ncbi:uncharacterized protein F4822DRAFT_430633 [Hypoxylon trugodes]|uniref:uncharacterized protein n=1 Tax=Hypoxylon trugodes TaxID=326681 RepID=UPI00219A5E1C|nr:uncharacterized protein F4822DRAFT_430633 [Hypoxylon trugodes]KAI1387883.1 hypothetical protein F4822DRAFT_430633 [Hypoxylon trugodes]
MLAEILHSLANDSNDSDGVAQLVVTALGSNGQHYICWKTHSGEYRQRSHGLPKALQDWLFPADSSTRDFETLQVILSGEDTFWASDRNGEMRSEPSGTQQRLRRALTISGETPAAVINKRRMSRARELSEVIGDSERPRSSTLPSSISPTTTTVDHLPGPHLNLKPPPASHSRSSSADKLRRIALVPLAFHQQRRSWATRPRSLVHGHEDLGVVKEQPSPRKSDTPVTPAPAVTRVAAKPPSPALAPVPVPTSIPTKASGQSCTCGHHHDTAAGILKFRSNVHAKARSGYADASVQTDPSPDPDPEDSIDEYHYHRRRRQHHERRESTLSVTSTADSYRSSYPSSKRSSFETVTTQPDPIEWGEKGGEEDWQPIQQHWEQQINPVRMGRMQDYFRSSTYTLGAALQPQGFI